MSDESQNDKFAGDLISDMVNTVRRAEAKNGGIRDSQTANAGDVTYEAVTNAFAETCNIASEKTNGAYRCTRGPHADGPCAAVPVNGQLFCEEYDKTLAYAKARNYRAMYNAMVEDGYDPTVNWAELRKDDVHIDGKEKSIQFTGKITGAEKLFGYPVILDDSVPFNKITFGPAPEIQPRPPISTLTFCHRISIMVVAFQMLRINKQSFNWRSITELGRYLFSGKLPGMDKPFKAAEKFAQGGVVEPSKNYYLVGEDSQGQEFKLGQDAIKSAIASFENFGKTVERTGASLSDFHKAANLIKHTSECEFQPKSAKHEQIDCTCSLELKTALKCLLCEHIHTAGGNDYLLCDDCGLAWDYRRTTAPVEGKRQLLNIRARAELWTRILTVYWAFPILWNVGLWNVERRTWAVLFNYVFRRIVPSRNPQSEHTIENNNPTQNARNKQHHHQPRPQSEQYAIIYLCTIAALWLLSLIVGIAFNWPAYR